MLISHSKRFIFVHIYKTAGTSIMDVFLPYARLVDRMVYGYRYSKALAGRIGQIMGWSDDGFRQFTGIHKHATASEIRDALGDSLFEAYYKFAFVRNPFDWLVSLYFYVKQSRSHRLYSVVAEMDFGEFLRWHIDRRPRRQIDFLIDPQEDTFIVDYVGRFETVRNDIGRISEALSIAPCDHLPQKNPSILRHDQDYSIFYDQNTRSLVEDYFCDDFRLLGYGFEGYEEGSCIMSG
jgi:glycosyltransferase involved in cell wall biosynthesis